MTWQGRRKSLKIRKRVHRRPPESPEDVALLEQICDAIQRLGVEVRQDAGYFRGGVCRLWGKKQVLFLNKNHRIEKRIQVALQALRELDNEKIYLAPSIRELLQRKPG